MTTADGAVIGPPTKIVDRGSSPAHWDLVLLSEGYQSAQLGQYATDAQNIADIILATPPFSQRRFGINVWRVDVSSTDSGADDPPFCGGVAGTGAVAATYFDATFCGVPGVHRNIAINQVTAMDVASTQVPGWDVILVIVNSPIYGGSGGAAAVTSLAPNATEIALHELGHSAFGLADEYDNLRGCQSGETDRDNHPGPEPMEPNVTLASTRATIKWRSLVLPTTPVPTTTNPDCTTCDGRPSPVPVGTVGAFEGAHYYHCGAYRPEYRCKMFELGIPFCAVCQRRIRQVLPARVPPVRELYLTAALSWLREEGLGFTVTGMQGPGAWVYRQSPAADTIVPAGSTVRLQVRTGPIP